MYDRSFDYYMARISRIPLEGDVYRQVLDTFDLVLGKLKKEEVRYFLLSLLGKNERIMLSKRFAAVLLLNQGLSISEISKRLRLTKQTVLRLSMIKQIKNQGFDLAIKKVNRDKMAKEINRILLGLAKESADLFFNWRIKPPNDYPSKR